MLPEAAVCFPGVGRVAEKCQDRTASPSFAPVGENAHAIHVLCYHHGSGLVQCHLIDLDAVVPLVKIRFELGALPSPYGNLVLFVAEGGVAAEVITLPGGAVLHITGSAGDVAGKSCVHQRRHAPVHSGVFVFSVKTESRGAELDAAVGQDFGVMEKVRLVPHESGLVVEPNGLDATAWSYGLDDHGLELRPVVIGGGPSLSEPLDDVEAIPCCGFLGSPQLSVYGQDLVLVIFVGDPSVGEGRQQFAGRKRVARKRAHRKCAVRNHCVGSCRWHCSTASYPSSRNPVKCSYSCTTNRCVSIGTSSEGFG